MFQSCKHCVLWLLLALPCPVLAETPLPNGAAFEVGFSPHRGALDVVLAAIGAAQYSVQVAAYGFSSKPVAMALLTAQQRGVNVQVVADRKDNRKAYSADVSCQSGRAGTSEWSLRHPSPQVHGGGRPASGVG